MQKNNRGSKLIKNIIGTAIILIIFYFIYSILMQFYFGEYVKAVHISGITEFRRDSETKYSEDIDSFKIISNEYNDAMFCREIDVSPNTSYKITCMVKTENVMAENNKFESGAQICIVDTIESSKSVVGTTDGWQKLEFRFNSKNREKVTIGFRLGGYADNCKGTVWFSNFDLQRGTELTSTEWNFACFIFKNIDTSIDGKNVKVSMDSRDINTVQQNMIRFKNSCSELSKNMMQVKYDIYEIDAPITSLSYDEENGYYLSASDANELISKYLEGKEYDHIFAAVRFGDKGKNIEIPVKGWMGLGGMEYLGMGFSNIRLPSDRENIIYEYYVEYNTFPEEVFIHEFLHSLERDLFEYGYKFPQLHDNEKYGYTNDNVSGLRRWYADYMTSNILDSQTGMRIGLDKLVYKLRPVHESSFEYNIDIGLGWKKDNLINVLINSIKILNTQIDLEKENVTIESF